jgi:hypothetical protein
MNLFNRIVALIWGVAGGIIGYAAVVIALGPKGDAAGWIMVAVFAAASAYCFWRLWREWNEAPLPRPVAPVLARVRQQQPASSGDFPGAWRGRNIVLETQIAALKDAGLAMASGRTIEELLTSWSRDQYESDPYGLLLFMYGSEVEAEPWGRFFFDRGWNFDMECVEGAGDYVRAFTQIVRITGQPNLVTEMSDNFDFEAETCEIKYTINGQARTLSARVDNDWADPEAAAAFVRDLETTIGDGRQFWAADNGQASVLFFLTHAEAAKVNSLRKDVLVRYVAD